VGHHDGCRCLLGRHGRRRTPEKVKGQDRLLFRCLA
jgi:hypothetical protein